MLRFWHRALGANKAREFNLFGGIRTDLPESQPQSSAVLVRAVAVRAWSQVRSSVLPHKRGDRRFERPCIPAGTQFRVEMILRSGRRDQELEEAALVMEVFTVLGAIGFRGNRGAGSVWPVDPPPPATVDDFRSKLSRLRAKAQALGLWRPGSALDGAYIDFYPEPFETAEAGRELCTDTIHDPSGALGYARPEARLSSPLRFKVVDLAQEPRKRRYWILRVGLPGPGGAGAGLELLRKHGKRIGQAGIRLQL